MDARVGDYVLAIDGQELKASDDPYRLLAHRNHAVTLTLNARPTLEGARRVTYTALESETSLRYLDFVLRTQERVAALSAGRVGYLHLPDLDSRGLAEFLKWYYPQIRKEALIVDVRTNQGGSISPVLLATLGRKLLGSSFRSGSEQAVTYPESVFLGPMVCLLNETTSSDGEIFAHHFRSLGLGPLIGTRTWGGVVGYSETGPLLDGGFVWVPREGTGGSSGRWIIEGKGVSPDLPIENNPKSLIQGKDLQLEGAVAEALRRLAKHRVQLPARPPDPVK